VTADANRLLVLGIWQTIIDADWTAMAALYDSDVIYHGPGEPALQGRDAVIELTKTFRDAFADMGFEAIHCIAQDDLVATHGRGTGTHSGPFRGSAATGRSVSVEIMYFMRLRDGRVIEEWEVFDRLDLMRQLGLA
jgi:steroid delta-isomerase-like uncharacterized protein